MPAVTLPPAPQPSESLSRPAFVSSMDAFVNWMYVMVPEFDAAITALNFNSTNSVSASTMDVDLTTKNFVIETGKSYVKGMVVILASTADPKNFMAGNVMAYDTLTGNMQVQPYMYRGSGTGLSSWTVSLSAPDPEGDIVFLGSVSASNSSQVDIEDSFDDFDCYMIIGTGISNNVNATISLRARMKIGGSYITTTTYQYSLDGATSGAATDHVQIDADISGTGPEHVDFVMNIFNPSSALPKTLMCHTTRYNGAGIGNTIRANNSNSGALTGIRFYPSTGNITAGKFSLYGVKNA